MTQFGKWLTLLVIGAIIVLLVTHPAGAAGDMAVSGSVLTNVLNIESGHGDTGGQTGSVTYGSTKVAF
ncbi:MAG: hypothetical protein ACREQ5_10715 [Candidatus Dormibacteria bacterium]